MTRLYSNNLSTTLNGAITDTATSMTLTSVTGFPAVGSGDTAQITLSGSGNVEVVTATAISGSVVTITRAQEGTSGVAFSDLSIVELRVTALSHTDVLAADTSPQLGGDLDMNGNQITSPDGTDLIDIPNGTIDLQTASSSRVDITDSGVRLGAANARVTTVLDEDAMGTDSATALATQQSIKAYVDANVYTTAAKVYKSAVQSIPTGTYTKVTHNTEDFDTGSNYDPTTNHRYTATVAGYYFVVGYLLYSSSLTDGDLVISVIRKNGSNVLAKTAYLPATAASQSVQCVGILYMNGSTDYIEHFVYHNRGVSVNAANGVDGTSMSISLLEAV